MNDLLEKTHITALQSLNNMVSSVCDKMSGINSNQKVKDYFRVIKMQQAAKKIEEAIKILECND